MGGAGGSDSGIPGDLRPMASTWQINFDDLELVKVLGRGFYSEVTS